MKPVIILLTIAGMIGLGVKRIFTVEKIVGACDYSLYQSLRLWYAIMRLNTSLSVSTMEYRC